jgi:hypothetical protein
MYAARAGPLYVITPTHIHHLICIPTVLFFPILLPDPVPYAFYLVASRPRHIVSAAPSCPGTLHVSYFFHGFTLPHIHSARSLLLASVIAGTCSVHVLGGPHRGPDSLQFSHTCLSQPHGGYCLRLNCGMKVRFCTRDINSGSIRFCSFNI